MDIGDILREARIRRGETIKDVEAALKIRGRYLQALEEDDFEVLPGPAFVKGFLRTYAGYLKLDADALVESYRAKAEPRSDEAVDLARLRATRTPLKPGPVRPRRRGQRGYILLGVCALIVVIVAAWFGLGAQGEGPAQLESSSLSDTTTTVETSGMTSSTGSETVGSTGTSSVVAGEKVNLTLSVSSSNCALVVRESSAQGKVLYQGQLSGDERLEYSSSDTYWLDVGNPTVLVVEVNGKEYPLEDPYGSFTVGKEGVERLE